MRITELAILVCMVFAGISVTIDLTQRNSIIADDLKVRYNEILFAATEDATIALMQPEDGKAVDILSTGDKNYIKIQPNLKKALEQFYKTLYINIGITDDLIAQDAFKEHVPVKLVTAFDGYYINAWEEATIEETGKKEIIEDWLPKKSYTFYEDKIGLIVNFTLDDTVSVFDVKKGNWIEGKAKEMWAVYPSTYLFENTNIAFEDPAFRETNFDKVRRRTIVDSVRSDLMRYCVRYNTLAKNYGKNYQFNFPSIPDDRWETTVNDVGFMGFLQGLVIGQENYSTYGFGGTRLTRKESYYGGVDGKYHKEVCSTLIPFGKPPNERTKQLFNSRWEAASEGYFPCNICKP